MNLNTQKIEAITEKTLVIGIDVNGQKRKEKDNKLLVSVLVLWT